ncbi:hypothetical protein V7085_23615, partial [Priestia megaterium]
IRFTFLDEIKLGSLLDTIYKVFVETFSKETVGQKSNYKIISARVWKLMDKYRHLILAYPS